MVRASIEAQPPQAGSPEGCNPFGRGLGVSPRTSYYSPFLKGRGSGGWCTPLLRRSPESRECSRTRPHPRLLRRSTPRKDGVVRGLRRSRGVPPLSLRVPPASSIWGGSAVPHYGAPSGESRGAQPLWQAVWRMCLHKLILFTTPFLSGRGSGGWSAPLSRRSPESRECSRTRPHPRLLRRSTPRNDCPYFSLCHARLTRAPRRRE